jgi:hypothetical protein
MFVFSLKLHAYIYIYTHTHNNQIIDAALYKLSSDDTLSNTKQIIHQNNFTNTNLNTLGK